MLFYQKQIAYTSWHRCLPALVGPQCLEELADDVLEGDVILLQALEIVTLFKTYRETGDGCMSVLGEVPQTKRGLRVCFVCVFIRCAYTTII